MGKSNIQWTEQTWNPIVGCSILSPGCKSCYAMKDAWRKHHNPALPHYHGLTKKVNGKAVWTGVVRESPKHILTLPLHTRKPTMWFVNSMSDLFHEDIPDEWIDKVIAVMGQCDDDGRGHTFQILTKRAERMRDYMNSKAAYKAWNNPRLATEAWPPRNIWLGVSTERQQEADERIPHLLQTPAAIRFVSAEPLLAPIDFRRIVAGERNGVDALTGFRWAEGLPGRLSDADKLLNSIAKYDLPDNLPGLDWIIVGGESGPVTEARTFDLRWARDIAAQCKPVGCACFIKQLGTNPVDSDLVAEGNAPAVGFKDKKGGDPSEWAPELRVREMPSALQKRAAA